MLQNVLLELLVTLTFCLAFLLKLRLVLADERHLVLCLQVVELLGHTHLAVALGLNGGDANLFFGGGLVETAVLAQLLSQRGFLRNGACRARGETAVRDALLPLLFELAVQFATVNGIARLGGDTTGCGLPFILGPLTFGHRGLQGLAGLGVAFGAKLVLGAHALPRVIGDGGGCVVGVSLLKTVLLGVLDIPGTVLSPHLAAGRTLRVGSLDGVVLPVFGKALLHSNLKGRVFVVSALVVGVIVQGHLHDVLFRVKDGVDAFVTFQRRVEERACAQREHADGQQGTRGEQAAAHASARSSSGAAVGGLHR